MDVSSRSTYHHGNLAPALIAAARDLLDQFGPGGVSLREAARRVGVSATATYRHFEDKDHLLAAISAQGYREFTLKLREAVAGPQGFAGMGIAYIDFALTHPGLFNLMFGQHLKERERFAELGAAADDAFAALVEGAMAFAGEAHQDLESIAYAAWSFAHGLSRLALDDVISRETAVKVSGAFLFRRPG